MFGKQWHTAHLCFRRDDCGLTSCLFLAHHFHHLKRCSWHHSTPTDVYLRTDKEKAESKGKGLQKEPAHPPVVPSSKISDTSVSSTSSSSSSSSSSSASGDTSPDEAGLGGAQVNADTLAHASAGCAEQPNTIRPAPFDDEDGAQATQAVQDGEGDPNFRLSPPIPLDRLVQGLCGESTDGASP